MPDVGTVAERLRAILSESLRLDPAELTEDRPFLQIATSSLELVDAFSRISRTFGVQPSLRRIFHEHGNLASLAEYVTTLVEEAEREGGPVAESAPGGEAIPLSPTQSWRLFLSELQPDARAAWSETLLVELRGRLDVERLTEAWRALCLRHEGLRARLVRTPTAALEIGAAGPALVVVQGSSATALPLQDWVAEVPNTGLVSATLRVVAPDQALLRVCVSELLADRAALGVALVELGLLYSGRALPEAPSLAGWSASRPDTAASLAWWLEQVRGRAPTDLPADRPRPAVKRYTGRRLVMPLDRATLPNEALFGPFLHLLTSFSVLLARLCAEDDLLLGVVSAPVGEDRGLLANRANPLPLPLHLDLASPFEAVRAGVRASLLDALDHADLPFPALVSALQPERNQSRSALFTVAFDREIWPALAFGGLEARVVATPGGGARYDLHLSLVEGPGLLQIQADYDEALFDAATVRRWLGSLRRLAMEAAAHPDTVAARLPLLNAEAEQQLAAWGQGPVFEADGEPLHAAFFARAEADPEGLAVCCGDARVSNSALAAMALRVAGALRARGLGEGDRVGVCLLRRPEALAALLGVLAAGAAYVPLDPAYPAARIASTVGDASLPLVLAEADTEAVLPAGTPVLRVESEMANLTEHALAPARPAPESVAYFIYTSGSTGQPKGVAIPHRAARNFVRWAHTAFDEADRALVLASTSFCFDLSIFEIFATLSGRGAVLLVDSAIDLPGQPAAEALTLINTVPSAMAELLRLGPLPPALRVVNLAGEPLRRALVDSIYREPGVERVYNLYGPSETTTYSTYTLVPRESAEEPTIGHPVGNTTVSLRDRAGALTPPGGVGELFIGGAGVALGYFGRPEQSAERFVPDPGAPGHLAYRTGDYARFGPDGALRFLGRKDDQVKVRGFRIELGAIEAALLSHPVLREAAVLAVGEDRRLVAWLARDPNVLVVHTPDWRAWLSSRLPAYMVPSAFVEVEALPRLPNGKVDRAALPVPDRAREARVADAYVPPRDDLERMVASIWSRQLGLERVGVHDDFFALGGDSLLLTSLMLEIKGRIGVRVSLAEFFDHPTVATLANRLRELARDKVNRTLVRRRISRTGPEVASMFARLAADGQLEPELRADGSAPPLETLLVTGVTGFVGSHTFYELLRSSKLSCRVLVRCTNPDEGRARVRKAMAGYGLWREEFEGRFTVAPGDLGRPRLGMDAARYESLSHEVDAVLHMAANVNFLYPYHALKPINVDGVREVLRLCFAGKPKPLHYMSTAALWPMGARFQFFEDSDIHHGVRLNLGYDESKWVAEVLVGQARQAGLPVTIYRPGEVSGHSESGLCVLDHFMFAIMKGSIQMGVFPDVKGFIDMAPVDYVARATATLVQDPAALGGTFQLNNPRPGLPAEMLEFLRREGYRFTVAPMDEWVTTLMLREDLTENALYPFIAILEEFEEENLQFPRYDTRLAQAALARHGVRCPPVEDALLKAYVDYFVGVGFLPRAPGR